MFQYIYIYLYWSVAYTGSSPNSHPEWKELNKPLFVVKRAFVPIARMRLYKRLCELKLLKKQAGFQGAFIDSSCVGLQFEHCADAEKFLTARGHELPITLPGLMQRSIV